MGGEEGRGRRGKGGGWDEGRWGKERGGGGRRGEVGEGEGGGEGEGRGEGRWGGIEKGRGGVYVKEKETVVTCRHIAKQISSNRADGRGGGV